MRTNPLAQLYSEFSSPFVDGLEGLRNAPESILRYDYALSADFDGVQQAFASGDLDATSLSRIELIHQPEAGVIGLVAYTATHPRLPALYLRSAYYSIACDGSRLADTLFYAAQLPESVWGNFAQELRNSYYTVVVSREVLAVSPSGDFEVLPESVSGEWIASVLSRQLIR